MCDLEEYRFNCGHNTFRLKAYCHFARNDPNHQCFGVKQLRESYEQYQKCESCQISEHQQQIAMPAYADHGNSGSRGSSYRR
ncbi:hypothetical protein GE09DRAFT_1217237 [Coniochaeta sp. 2T2.1]|nr:hypothetical protein GE09DRAFT_1217237 [Coniochaeta sp. 2T2.1]